MSEASILSKTVFHTEFVVEYFPDSKISEKAVPIGRSGSSKPDIGSVFIDRCHDPIIYQDPARTFTTSRVIRASQNIATRFSSESIIDSLCSGCLR